MKTATLSYTEENVTKTTILTFEYDQDDQIGRARIDGQSFPDSPDWNEVENEQEGIEDLVLFAQDNLMCVDGISDLTVVIE